MSIPGAISAWEQGQLETAGHSNHFQFTLRQGMIRYS